MCGWDRPTNGAREDRNFISLNSKGSYQEMQENKKELYNQ
jgi:hypothetical protein